MMKDIFVSDGQIVWVVLLFESCINPELFVAWINALVLPDQCECPHPLVVLD